MSDNIVINITPSPIDPVLVNVSSTSDNIEIDTSSYGVVSVNGKTGPFGTDPLGPLIISLP